MPPESEADLTRTGTSRRDWLRTLGAAAMSLGAVQPTAAGRQDTTFDWLSPWGPANRQAVPGMTPEPKQKPSLNWRLSTTDTPSPIYQGGTLYAGQDDGAVIAVDEQSGGKIQLYQMPADTYGAYYNNGALYMLDDNATYMKLNPTTGAVNWRRTLPAYPTGQTFVDDQPYVGLEDGRALVINPNTGATAQELTVPFDNKSDNDTMWIVPEADGTTVYLNASGQGTVAHDTTTGSTTWKTAAAHTYIPAHDDTTVFNIGWTDRETVTVTALAKQSGARRWKSSKNVGAEWAGFAITDTHVYVSGGQTLVAFKRDSGEEAWSSGLSTAELLGTRTLLYAVTRDTGELVGLNPETGVEHWRFRFNETVGRSGINTPIPTQRGLAVPYADNLYCFTHPSQ